MKEQVIKSVSQIRQMNNLQSITVFFLTDALDRSAAIQEVVCSSSYLTLFSGEKCHVRIFMLIVANCNITRI